MRAIRSFLRSRGSGFVVVLSLLLLWQVASVNHIVDPVFIPPATDTLRTWLNVMSDGTLRDPLISTVTRFAVGYALAVLIGIGVGVLVGYWRTCYALFEPTLELLRPVPPPAIVPIFILLLGIENRMKITVVVFAAVFPVIVNTIQGVRGVDPVLLDTARTFGYGRLAIVRRIILPAALPSIFAGMRISLAIALIVTVFAEMLAGSDGVGYYVLNAERGFEIPQMYAGVITLAGLGYVMNTIFVSIERIVLHWHLQRAST